MSDLKKIKDELLLKLKSKLNLSEVNQMKSDLFGKNGLVSSQFKKIGTIAETERKKFASELNVIKDELQDLINLKIKEIENEEIREKLQNELNFPLRDENFLITYHPVTYEKDYGLENFKILLKVLSNFKKVGLILSLIHISEPTRRI